MTCDISHDSNSSFENIAEEGVSEQPTIRKCIGESKTTEFPETISEDTIDDDEASLDVHKFMERPSKRAHVIFLF